MNHSEFEPLRDMESFTEDMFNRVIAFQEKQHPAWNQNLGFSKRIEGLPLHYLIFSNADRDPEKFSATVAPYYPIRGELQKLAYYARQVSDQPQVCDLYCGNGFIGSLLANEGLQVTGLSRYTTKPNQISEFFDADSYSFSNKSLQDFQCDVVIANWIPSGENPTTEIMNCTIKPKLIVYTYTDHVHEETGNRQTGTNNMFEPLKDSYELIEQWSITRPENLLHEIWPDMTPNIEETRITRIYAHQSCKILTPPQSLPTTTPYDWEKELHMAMLALKAKQEIRARGINV